MKLRDFRLGQSDDGDACKLQVLVESGDIGLIAADAVECLGNDRREQAALRISDHLLDAMAKNGAGTRYRRILIAACTSKPSRLACSSQRRNWSIIEASRWLSPVVRRGSSTLHPSSARRALSFAAPCPLSSTSMFDLPFPDRKTM